MTVFIWALMQEFIIIDNSSNTRTKFCDFPKWYGYRVEDRTMGKLRFCDFWEGGYGKVIY